MHYDECIIDGRLMFRIDPQGAWIPSTGSRANIVNALCDLDDDAREELFSLFCLHCYTPQRFGSRCQCWNDE